LHGYELLDRVRERNRLSVAVGDAVASPGALVTSGARATLTTATVGATVLAGTVWGALATSIFAGAVIARAADTTAAISATFLVAARGRTLALELVGAGLTLTASAAVTIFYVATFLIETDLGTFGRQCFTDVLHTPVSVLACTAIAHPIENPSAVKPLVIAGCFTIWWVIVEAFVIFAPLIGTAVAATSIAAIVSALVLITGVLIGTLGCTITHALIVNAVPAAFAGATVTAIDIATLDSVTDGLAGFNHIDSSLAHEPTIITERSRRAGATEAPIDFAADLVRAGCFAARCNLRHHVFGRYHHCFKEGTILANQSIPGQGTVGSGGVTIFNYYLFPATRAGDKGDCQAKRGEGLDIRHVVPPGWE